MQVQQTCLEVDTVTPQPQLHILKQYGFTHPPFRCAGHADRGMLLWQGDDAGYAPSWPGVYLPCCRTLSEELENNGQFCLRRRRHLHHVQLLPSSSLEQNPVCSVMGALAPAQPPPCTHTLEDKRVLQRGCHETPSNQNICCLVLGISGARGSVCNGLNQGLLADMASAPAPDASSTDAGGALKIWSSFTGQSLLL